MELRGGEGHCAQRSYIETHDIATQKYNYGDSTAHAI